MKNKRFKRAEDESLNLDEMVSGIVRGERKWLAKGITIIESQAKHHQILAKELLKKLSSITRKTSIRVGITGVPGVGKSTFIESFGSMLCDQGLHVAVLAIDPSSSLSGGSILGDKTRMESLARNDLAFIRPSPTAGTLGGVHRKTRETMLLCEAAGYDIVLVETVGVGQSEYVVREMVDYFMLLTLTGAGDELQGMKKGIMELADGLFVHKADGDNVVKANKTVSELNQLLHFLQPSTPGWTTKAYPLSSTTKIGLEEVWTTIRAFIQTTKESGQFIQRRTNQRLEWLRSSLEEEILDQFYQKQQVQTLLPLMKEQVKEGTTNVREAVDQLLQVIKK
ncbi:methylmalonyl Co-A mutase-associated GTPase MeaB [Bacillus coahuilensis]|uniref:methylmalonyl Co-A mutase-associated GTPase MeaB n=1 Tax=Bacillus coahuilensis TaxID=408580 RepID=UPI0009EC283D|nr:methylmalonyl Co-A mutase-associated GTPase MeaB [Bacillus coahuilensis]